MSAGSPSRDLGGWQWGGDAAAGGVVGGVVGPAAPEDACPAGAQAAQCPVFALAAGAGVVVDLAGPVVLAGGHEGPPVHGVADSAGWGLAGTEPDGGGRVAGGPGGARLRGAG